MTKYHELQSTKRSAKKRVGRGISAGQGKTAGRGTKGQNARTGNTLRTTFMGGQGSLVQRIPKARGFKSKRTPSQVVYLDQLSAFEKSGADNHSLHAAGVIKTPNHDVKIVGRGELAVAVTVKVQRATESSIVAIKKAGGSFEKVPVPLKIKQSKNTSSSQ